MPERPLPGPSRRHRHRPSEVAPISNVRKLCLVLSLTLLLVSPVLGEGLPPASGASKENDALAAVPAIHDQTPFSAEPVDSRIGSTSGGVAEQDEEEGLVDEGMSLLRLLTVSFLCGTLTR